MKKMLMIVGLLSVVSLNAAHYPDSIRQASDAEMRIQTGVVFEIGGSVGLGGFTFGENSTYTTNTFYFPAWNAGVMMDWYFLPWMGIGVGAEFSQVNNKTQFDKAWEFHRLDYQGHAYDLTGRPHQLYEQQTLTTVELPLMLQFRYIPSKVGFFGRAGVKFGLPMRTTWSLKDGGYFDKQVYYPHWDLTLNPILNVLEKREVAGQSGRLDRSQLADVTYSGYLELGALFRLSQRVDLSLALFGQYTFTDVLDPSLTKGKIGFGDAKEDLYPMPFAADYQGVLHTNETSYLRPWMAGLRVAFHFNTGRTQAQKQYDREQRAARRAARQAAKEASLWTPEPVVPVVPTDLEEIVEPELSPRDSALQAIRELAARYAIDLCEGCCPVVSPEVHTQVVHDTIYAQREDTIVRSLDDMLKAAVIFFNFDSYSPKIEPADLLVRIADILRRYPDQRIEISGHASPEGKAEYNRKLALRRAHAVADQLRQLGVQDSQMQVNAYGADQPYRYNGQHQVSKDRRVEIVPMGTLAAPVDTVVMGAESDPVLATEVVREGSRLAQIARHYYGVPYYWPFIWQANAALIKDPAAVTPGTELVIPDLSLRLKGLSMIQCLEEAQRVQNEMKSK